MHDDRKQFYTEHRSDTKKKDLIEYCRKKIDKKIINFYNYKKGSDKILINFIKKFCENIQKIFVEIDDCTEKINGQKFHKFFLIT